MANKSGQCFLVGAGPGDMGLVTLAGKECIERNADWISEEAEFRRVHDDKQWVDRPKDAGPSQCLF